MGPNDCGANVQTVQTVRKKTKGAMFPLLETLTVDRMKDEAETLNAEIAAGGDGQRDAEDDDGDVEAKMKILRDARELLDKAPLSLDAPRIALEIAARAKPAERQLRRNQFANRLLRAQAMKAGSRPWNWVDFDVAEEVERRWEEMKRRDIRKGGDLTKVDVVGPLDDWIDVVMKMVLGGLVRKAGSIELDPKQHSALQCLQPNAFSYPNPHQRRNFTVQNSLNDLGKCMLAIVRDLLPQWLQFGCGTVRETSEERVRAWFVQTVGRAMGDEMLTTDMMWAIYTNFKPRRYVDTDRQYRTRTLETYHIKPFEDALRGHPMLQVGTNEAENYRLYKQILQEGCRENCRSH